jgi:hypothetical protein
MKVISLWQPWTTLMAIGSKRIETRGWSTRWRGSLAIYSTLAWNRDCRMMAGEQLCWDMLRDGRIADTWTSRAGYLRPELPFGAIIAVCDLIDCLPTEASFCIPGVFDDYPEMDTPQERAFGNYEPGRYGLVTSNMFQLPEPIPFKSRQGKLLDLPAEICAEVNRQWKATA